MRLNWLANNVELALGVCNGDRQRLELVAKLMDVDFMVHKLSDDDMSLLDMMFNDMAYVFDDMEDEY